MKPGVNPERIERAYKDLGYTQGWRFMSCPERNFDKPKVLLVTLNPGGGSGIDRDNPTWSQERGSSYLHESWGLRAQGKDSLQIQVQKMFDVLNLPIDEAASAYFVPFRSPRWAMLSNRKAAVAFARDLWADIAGELRPEYLICLGTTVGAHMRDLFGVENIEKSSTGWGRITLGLGNTNYGGRFLVFPHLGTFKLFSREQCEPHLRAALISGNDNA